MLEKILTDQGTNFTRKMFKHMQITKNREDSDNSLPSGKQRNIRTLTPNIAEYLRHYK